jgi:hypothetical protein
MVERSLSSLAPRRPRQVSVSLVGASAHAVGHTAGHSAAPREGYVTTATNQWPSCSTVAPPSSCASSLARKKRL